LAKLAFPLHRRLLALHLKNVDWTRCDAGSAERAKITIQHFRYERAEQFRFGYCDMHVMHFPPDGRALLIGISHIA
jgi:hypothetical protein